MRRWSIEKSGKIIFDKNYPEPEPGRDQLLIKVKACTVCGRSDLIYYYYYNQLDHCREGIFGHEISGIVTKCGESVRKFKVGDRVFVRTIASTGYADYAIADETASGHLPDDISFEQGAALQLLPLAVHSTRGVNLGDKVLIIGQGPVGLMTLQAVKLRGASYILAVDLDSWRLSVSTQLGATATLQGDAGNLIAEIMNVMPEGFDVAIDAVGIAKSVNICTQSLRKNGLLVLIGTHHVDAVVPIDMIQWEKKRLQIHTAAESNDAARSEAIRVSEHLIRYGKIKLEELISHTYSLEDLPFAIEKLSDNVLLQKNSVAPRPTAELTPRETLKIAIVP